MVNGIIIKPIKRLSDERGFIMEIMRKDWKDLFGNDNIAQANLSHLPKHNTHMAPALKRANRLFNRPQRRHKPRLTKLE